MNPSLFGKVTAAPAYDPSYLNPDYIYSKVLNFRQYLKGLQANNIIYTVAYLITLFGITITLYCLVRLYELNKEEFGHLRHAIHEAHEREHERNDGLNPRWINVENLVHSDNPSDWRLAIIEADTMLEDALESKELSGNGIGEKLKNSTPGDLASLQAAWEAHLVRNRIAHEGTEFDISQREAKRTILLYEVVFKELNYI